MLLDAVTAAQWLLPLLPADATVAVLSLRRRIEQGSLRIARQKKGPPTPITT
eukprot:GDKH01009983.1.p2 GENE.GDKH01009983.1~~GDKH01009983.1.p2  ORF type:complete len:52 (-),score=3.20 GDKH01009983.1:15-170(-)